MYCKACGAALGSPEEDLHDPDGLSDVAKELGITPENPDAHLIVRDGSRGWRYYCDDLGQVTSIVPEPPDEGGGEGEGPPPNEDSEQPQQPPPNGGDARRQVYDIPEEKSPLTVLAEVITAPFLGLNDDQIAEVRDWADDYDGQLPPDMLEDILGNLNGVQKQAATLARQKYEVKLNKWVQEQARGDDGPPIGISSPPPRRRQRGGRRGRDRGSREGSVPQREPPDDDDDDSYDVPTGDLRRYRRVRRTERRNNAADVAMERAAEQIAEQAGAEIASNFGTYFGLPAKIIEAKIKKDPDWFFEKMDEWDIDLDSFLQPSEARKKEMEEQGTPEVDREVDSALDRMRGAEGKEEMQQPQEEPSEEGLFDEDEETEEQEPEEGEGDFFDKLEPQGAAPGGGM